MVRGFKMHLAALVTTCAVLQGSVGFAQQADIVDTAVSAGSFNTLAAALKAGGLIDALKSKGPFTVFAPTDDAFAKLPAGTVETLLKPENKGKLVSILKYHVVKGIVKAENVVKLTSASTLNGQRASIKVAGGMVMLDNARVVKTDIPCSNGVIHVIDSVILPKSENIVETAAKAGSFKTLIAAAKAAGLAGALTGDKPLTVFAPTDAAFAKLPKGTVENLLKPENKEDLKRILLYHVVAGRVYSDQALKLSSANTLAKAPIKIRQADGAAYINDSKLIKLDIETSNGVIHVIDSVLLPPKKTAAVTMHPMQTIEHAVRTGAGLYNSGHHAGCANHYMTTISQMLRDNRSQMPSHVVAHLESSMRTASQSSCMDSRSWTLRHSLDYAYTAMVQR